MYDCKNMHGMNNIKTTTIYILLSVFNTGVLDIT
jgi:hypothetical protein